MSQVYTDIFDRLWYEGRYKEAIDAYFYVDRIFERSKWVAGYYQHIGQIDKAMLELEFFIESCMQISDHFLPYPSGPVELYLLALWFERFRPWKVEQYLKLYLQAEKFEQAMGEGIAYKIEAEELLKKIQMARNVKKQEVKNETAFSPYDVGRISAEDQETDQRKRNF